SGILLVCAGAFVFFFSSRRRHTRWPRDWSSDVCSSDLNLLAGGTPAAYVGLGLTNAKAFTQLGRIRPAEYKALVASPQVRLGNRSEERRVGKECRSRWATYD